MTKKIEYRICTYLRNVNLSKVAASRSETYSALQQTRNMAGNTLSLSEPYKQQGAFSVMTWD